MRVRVPGELSAFLVLALFAGLVAFVRVRERRVGCLAHGGDPRTDLFGITVCTPRAP